MVVLKSPKKPTLLVKTTPRHFVKFFHCSTEIRSPKLQIGALLNYTQISHKIKPDVQMVFVRVIHNREVSFVSRWVNSAFLSEKFAQNFLNICWINYLKNFDWNWRNFPSTCLLKTSAIL